MTHTYITFMYTLKDPQNGSVLNLDSSGPEKEEKKERKKLSRICFNYNHGHISEEMQRENRLMHDVGRCIFGVFAHRSPMISMSKVCAVVQR